MSDTMEAISKEDALASLRSVRDAKLERENEIREVLQSSRQRGRPDFRLWAVVGAIALVSGFIAG